MLNSYKCEYSLKSNYYMNECYQKNNEENNKNIIYCKYRKYLKRKYIANLLLIIPVGYCSILFYMYINKS